MSCTPGNCAGVPYCTPPSRARPTPWPAVRSRTPRGSGTRRGPCCETTPRNRSATGLPGATYSAPEPVPSSHDRTTSAANSGPLSLRIRHGGPPPGRDLGQDDPDVLGGHAPARLQRQAFSGVLINDTQPLEAPTVAGTIEDKVPCPYIVFAARRPEMAGVPILSMLPAGLGIGPRSGHFQPRLALEPPHRLLVDRPALAIQQGPDPPVAEPWVRPASSSIRRANAACSSRSTGA